MLGDMPSISIVMVRSTVSFLWMSIWYADVTFMLPEPGAAEAGEAPTTPMRAKTRTLIAAVRRCRPVRTRRVLMAGSLRHNAGRGSGPVDCGLQKVPAAGARGRGADRDSIPAAGALWWHGGRSAGLVG